MRYRIVLLTAFAVAASICNFSAHADESDSPEEIVVVATRTPQSLDKVGNSVTVLDAAQIQQSQRVDLTELLATTPGITFSRNGGPGNVTSVNIRGADSDHTLIMIDGVVLTDPSTTGGSIDFGNLIVGDIARIEILRGAQSTLYGSQAIGGVINIETAQPHDGLGGTLVGEKGSLDSGLAQAAIGAKYEDWSFRVSASDYSTKSVSDFDRQYGGLGDDPYHNAVLSGRASYEFTSAGGPVDVTLDLRGYYTNSTVDYDGFPPPDFVFGNQLNYQTTRQYFGYAGLNFNFLDGQFKNRIDIDYTHTDRADYLPSDSTTIQNDHYSGTDSRVEYQGNLAIVPGYSVVFGGLQEKYLMDSTPYAPAHADTGDTSAYAQFQAEVVKGLNLTAGERFDRYDAFGEHFTGQVAAAWALPSSTIFRASWGQGFKAPSLYQLYSLYGTSNLRAERSRDWDAGVEQRFWGNRITAGITYFNNDFKNLIDFDNCPGSPLCDDPAHSQGYYANVGREKSSGEEFQIAAKLTNEFTLSANYTHLKTLDDSPGSLTYGMQLLRRPGQAANLSANYSWPIRLDTSIAVRYSGPSTDENFNAFPAAFVNLGGYTLVDLHATYSISNHFEVYARVDNLADKRYETVYQYGTWGRTAFAGARLKY
jgi:vitamin B12 transporter